MKLCQNTLSDLGIKGGFTQLGLHSHFPQAIRMIGGNIKRLSYLLV